jgi:hypothetical protein
LGSPCWPLRADSFRCCAAPRPGHRLFLSHLKARGPRAASTVSHLEDTGCAPNRIRGPSHRDTKRTASGTGRAPSRYPTTGNDVAKSLPSLRARHRSACGEGRVSGIREVATGRECAGSPALPLPLDRDHGSSLAPHPRHRTRPSRSSTLAWGLSPSRSTNSGASNARRRARVNGHSATTRWGRNRWVGADPQTASACAADHSACIKCATLRKRTPRVPPGADHCGGACGGDLRSHIGRVVVAIPFDEAA